MLHYSRFPKILLCIRSMHYFHAMLTDVSLTPYNCSRTFIKSFPFMLQPLAVETGFPFMLKATYSRNRNPIKCFPFMLKATYGCNRNLIKVRVNLSHLTARIYVTTTYNHSRNPIKCFLFMIKTAYTCNRNPIKCMLKQFLRNPDNVFPLNSKQGPNLIVFQWKGKTDYSITGVQNKSCFGGFSPWVIKNSCTRWVAGSDVIFKGFHTSDNRYVQVG